MDVDLRERLDRSLTDPPPLRLDRHVASGRRALRRRRLAASAGGVAAALVLVGTGFAVGGAPTSAPEPAVPAPAAAPDAPTPAASYDDATGRLDVAPGWEVRMRIGAPLGEESAASYREGEHSVALELGRGEELQWALLTWSPDSGGTATVARVPNSFWTFQDWVAFRVAAATGTSTDLLVQARPDGRLTPRDPVSYLDQQPAPSLSLHGRTVTVARATVTGETWCLLVVQRGGPYSTYPLPCPPGDLDAFAEQVAPDVEAGRYP